VASKLSTAEPQNPEDLLTEAAAELKIGHKDLDDPSTADSEIHDPTDLEPLDVQIERIPGDETALSSAQPSAAPPLILSNLVPEEPEVLYDDPSSSDDGEGEWITPSNVGLHKSRALHLVPDESPGTNGKKAAPKQIRAGCMTADFAMQNVLLQMGLSLVGVEGKRIERVKTWVLRCHACFKYVLSHICSPNVGTQCHSHRIIQDM
jgi:RNA-binding protein NOB1